MILHDILIIGETMPDDKEKQEGKLVDIDTSGLGAEVDSTRRNKYKKQNQK